MKDLMIFVIFPDLVMLIGKQAYVHRVSIAGLGYPVPLSLYFAAWRVQCLNSR